MVSAIISQLAKRENYGFRDTPAESDEPQDEERDMPEGFDAVPAGMRLWRWELRDPATALSGLSEEMQSQLASRIEQREAVRDTAKKLLSEMTEQERKEICTKGLKTAAPSEKKAEKGMKKRASASGAESEDDKGEGSSAGNKSTSVKKPRTKKSVEETEEEAAEKAKKKEEREKRKAEKAEKDKAKEAKNRERQEKEEVGDGTRSA